MQIQITRRVYHPITAEAGETVDVPARAARQLCRDGHARPAAPVPETADKPTRRSGNKPTRRSGNKPTRR